MRNTLNVIFKGLVQIGNCQVDNLRKNKLRREIETVYVKWGQGSKNIKDACSVLQAFYLVSYNAN